MINHNSISSPRPSFFSTLLQKFFGKPEQNNKANGRTLATFNLRSQEVAKVRQLLSQGKNNEALAYMQSLSGATQQ